MNSEFDAGFFQSDLNGANAQILVNPQPVSTCIDIFDADEQRMVLTNSNERTLFVYTFSSREWQSLTLPLEIPNITGLSLIGDCVLVRTPPQVICYNFVKNQMLFEAYIPDVIGFYKWPFNAFRACSNDCLATLYLATKDNDIAVINLDNAVD